MSTMARPTAYARGYGRKHQAERAHWAPKVDAGLVDCARCGQRLEPGRPWDLGHNDSDRGQYNGPEHVTCNRGAGGKNGRAVQLAGRGRHTSRAW